MAVKLENRRELWRVCLNILKYLGVNGAIVSQLPF